MHLTYFGLDFSSGHPARDLSCVACPLERGKQMPFPNYGVPTIELNWLYALERRPAVPNDETDAWLKEFFTKPTSREESCDCTMCINDKYERYDDYASDWGLDYLDNDARYVLPYTTLLNTCVGCNEEYVAKEASSKLCDHCRGYCCEDCGGDLSASNAATCALRALHQADASGRDTELKRREAQRVMDELGITGKLEAGCRGYGHDMSFLVA